MLYVAGTFGGLCADYSLVCGFLFCFFFFFVFSFFFSFLFFSVSLGEKRGEEGDERKERDEN